MFSKMFYLPLIIFGRYVLKILIKVLIMIYILLKNFFCMISYFFRRKEAEKKEKDYFYLFSVKKRNNIPLVRPIS